MLQSNCLNFCEIMEHLYEADSTLNDIIDEANKMAGFEKCERIYIGSYFCSQYFIHLSNEILRKLGMVCKERGIRVTLVIPTFSEKDLEKGKERVEIYKTDLGTCTDEMTVNDYGMLVYISQNYDIKLNMGRLFMKDYRDPRYEEYFNQTLQPKIFTTYLKDLIKKNKISGLEFDPTHRAIDLSEKPEGIHIGIHEPYCYMTVGHICEFASIHKEIDKKFRPNTSCQRECTSHIMRYNLHDGHNWIRVGRAIYFDNRTCDVKGSHERRIIYFPIDLEVGE